MPEDWQHGGFGLYVHWPYCQAKCPYCDFNSHVATSIDQRRWAEAYVHEIERLGRETGPRVLDSIFFGGGTPSLMEPDLVAEVIETARRTWPTRNDVEVTLEANPTSVEAERFAGYRAAGVNRVSLGLQALNDADLKRLGRLHDVEGALAALRVARETFERVSFDLIYARQGQGLADWEAELGKALTFGPDHMSLYQLTIEPGTAFGALHRAGKLRDLPDEDLSADLYEATQRICEAAGLPAYEVSNHARPGAESRHNLIYWHYGDYAGVGPGAHGRLTLGGRRMATSTELLPARWLERVEQAGHGELPRETLTDEAVRAEVLLMGMRLEEGISLSRLENLGWEAPASLELLQDEGLLEMTDDRLRVTRRGRPVLNAVLGEIIA